MPSTNLFVLEGQDKGQFFSLDTDKSYVIGRSPHNDIQINDKCTSRHHLKILKKGKTYILTDLNSENGTFVNGKNMEPGIDIEVKEGTPIVIGMTILGLGDVCKAFLEPILEAIGISGEGGGKNKIVNPYRTATFKNNLKFIYNLSNELMMSEGIHEVLEKTSNGIFQLLKRIDRCVVISTNGEKEKISDIVYKSRKPIGDGETVYNHQLVTKSLLLNKLIYVFDSSDEYSDKNYNAAETLRMTKIRSAMCIPICNYLRTMGAIYVDTLERAYGFRTSDIPLLKDVSCRVAQVMDYIGLLESLTNNKNGYT
jgi:pSer/pThr/pTyr-binding forkhead associated (FHA) protein